MDHFLEAACPFISRGLENNWHQECWNDVPSFFYRFLWCKHGVKRSRCDSLLLKCMQKKWSDKLGLIHTAESKMLTSCSVKTNKRTLTQLMLHHTCVFMCVYACVLLVSV